MEVLSVLPVLWRGRKVDHLSTRLEEDSSAPSPELLGVGRRLSVGSSRGLSWSTGNVNYFGGC